MPKAKPQPITFQRIVSGIADYEKESVQVDSVAFARQIDFRTNPRKWKILPKTIKESGSVIIDLPMWGDRISTDTYIYGDTGSIYKRTSAGSVSLEKSVANSHGNGLKYFGEDGFMYYATDIALGRFGRIGSSPTYVDDFLTAEGGVPLNTHSLDLESGSSRYATAADSASLSITGDIALECWIKPESLPAAAAEMVLMSKWNEQSDKRSYKFSINTISGYFGDGSDGSTTISSNTTEAPIDSACSGTSGANSLSATNASFASNQIILIHQSQGSGVGTWQRNKIISYTAGTITLETPLNYSYSSSGANKAQVRVMKQFGDVTVNSGITWTAKAWDGSVGGILAFISNGTLTVTGSINATGKGYRGGSQRQDYAYTGEGDVGVSYLVTANYQRNGNGGSGGHHDSPPDNVAVTGGGGGNGTAGQVGNWGAYVYGGLISGNSALTSMTFGGGGGGGSKGDGNGGTAGNGSPGGGIIFISANIITVSGSIVANGSVGQVGADISDGGSGAGGSILLKFTSATLGSSLITASGGASPSGNGGQGGDGRIHADYYTSFTGTTSPTIDSVSDNSLAANITYQLRLQVSQTGANEETYSKPLAAIAVDKWGHYAVSWDAATSTATFAEDGVTLGSVGGAFTAIFDGNALFALGASFSGAGAAENFFDGKIDEPRVWGAERTVAQFSANKEVELAGTETNLKAYFQLDNSASDSTANANNLTLVNSPVYSTDVPFSAPTTRQDIDQQDTSTGATYALAIAIDEGASHRQTFVPAKDPQKSIGIYISDTGDDSDWTVTVHDPQNRLIASATIAHALLHTGHNEFIFSDVWRPIVGASYHFHVTATTTTGTPLIVSGTSNNLETGQFKSYYQFLVEDIFHPIEQTGNLISIGNERYVATYDASSYNPHRLTLPSGWRIRCIAKWREYYAYGCMRGDSVSDYDQGLIVFWDGYSTTYNFFVEVPEGGINAMLGSQGTLYIVAGYQGDVLEYAGGDRATKVKRVPKITDDKYVEVLPGAMSMWRTLLHIGVGVTDSDLIEQGVYSWGKRNNQYVDSLSFDYKISSGTTKSSGVKIGMVMPVNKKLLIGFKDGTAYGLDNVDPTNDPYSEGSIEWLIRDEGGVWKEKKIDMIRADFGDLESGESVSLQYKLDDHGGDWSAAEVEDTVGSKLLRWQPEMTRHKEWQVRVNLMTSVSTSPEVLAVNVMEDTLTDEEVT